MSNYHRNYNMGHTRAHRFPAPVKVRFTEHNGRTVVANPSGVPARWLPIYLECASRMYDGGPSFAIGKDENERGNPVTLRIKDGCQWATIGDPKDAARILGMVDDAPIAPKPKAAPKPKSVPTPAECEAIVGPAMVITPEAIMAASEPVWSPPAIPTGPLPQWAEEWLAQLVYEPKRDYARALLAHLLNGAPAPPHPGTEWAHKAHKRASRLIEKAA